MTKEPEETLEKPEIETNDTEEKPEEKPAKPPTTRVEIPAKPEKKPEKEPETPQIKIYRYSECPFCHSDDLYHDPKARIWICGKCGRAWQ